MTRIPLTLRATMADELPVIHALEISPEIAPFVHGQTLDEHARQFSEPGFVYLTFIADESVFAGYCILVRHDDFIELRRIALALRDKGLGTRALGLLESHCRDELGAKRMRLDVFEKNSRGVHLYEKLGWRLSRAGVQSGDDLLRYYEKTL